MQIDRADSSNFAVDSLPDGSRIIRDPDQQAVYALNPTAAAAWEACSSASTISDVAEEMRRSFDSKVTDELAEASLQELQEMKLITITGAGLKATRRQVLAGLGAVALPLVVSLTVGEQKAHAEHAGSFDNDHRDRPRANVPKNQKRPF